MNEFLQAGYDALVPFGDGHPYDLVVSIDGAFLRVQCKTSWLAGGCLLFNAYATDHGRGQGSYVGRADLFGVYLPPTRGVYIVPVGIVKNTCMLRIDPPRNNQRRRVRFAEEFEFTAWSREDFLRYAPLPRSPATKPVALAH